MYKEQVFMKLDSKTKVSGRIFIRVWINKINFIEYKCYVIRVNLAAALVSCFTPNGPVRARWI